MQSDGSLMVQSERPAIDEQVTLPKDHLEPIQNLLVQACPFTIAKKEDNCADCYIYDLRIEMNGQSYDIQASDMTLNEELRPLITTLDEFFQVTGQ